MDTNQPSEDGATYQSCPVCFCALTDTASAMLDTCGHSFCEDCIVTWSKRQLKCPMCKSEFASITVRGETTVCALPTQQAAELDMSGLDHDFYLAECTRLLDNSKEAQRRLFAAPNGVFFTRGRAMTSTPAWKALHQLRSQLQNIEQDLRREARFDPTHLWDHLSRIDAVLKDLWVGSVTFLDGADLDGGGGTALRLSADDALLRATHPELFNDGEEGAGYYDDEDGSGDDDDDDDGDEYDVYEDHPSLSRANSRGSASVAKKAKFKRP